MCFVFVLKKGQTLPRRNMRCFFITFVIPMIGHDTMILIGHLLTKLLFLNLHTLYSNGGQGVEELGVTKDLVRWRNLECYLVKKKKKNIPPTNNAFE